MKELLEVLRKIQRFEIDPQENGEYIELDKRLEDDGQYILSADLDKIIKQFENIK